MAALRRLRSRFQLPLASKLAPTRQSPFAATLDSLESRHMLSAAVATVKTTKATTAATEVARTTVYSPKSDVSNARKTDKGLAYTQYKILGPADGVDASPLNSPSSAGKSPAQIRGAYGVSNILFGGVVGDGSGQTIAIIDAYDSPSFVSSTASNFAVSDLARFDAQYGLPDPVFTKVNQSGGTTYPTYNSGWAGEIALDVEWTHAMAPKANIILVEASSSSTSNLFAAVNWAKAQPGVSAISMSFGSTEYSGESAADTYFTTGGTHTGVTYLASTGDSGAPGSHPAYSQRVVAVGGTSLTVSGITGTTYSNETGWANSGGGISTQIAKPAYQNLVTTPSATFRTTPDVSMVANPNTGVNVLDSSAGGIGSTPSWNVYGGTSLSAPLWAGLIAVANQGRVLEGLSPIDGPSTLTRLYTLNASDYHDITSGNNGFAAAAGYDLVTGRGSPKADQLIPHLAGGSISGSIFSDNNADGTQNAGENGAAGVSVYIDANNNGTQDSGEAVATTDSTGSYTLADLAGGLTYTVRLATTTLTNYLVTSATNLSAAVSYGTTGGLNFSLFPRTITGALLTVSHDATSNRINIYNTADTSSTPAYTIDPSLLGSTPLTLVGTSAADSFTVDFSNGALGVAGGIKLTTTAASDTLHVIGTSNADIAQISVQNPSTLITLASTTITVGTIGTIDLHVGDGNDEVDIASLTAATSLKIDLGTGADLVDVGSASGALDSVNGVISVAGGAADDSVVIDDSASTSAHSYVFGGTTAVATFNKGLGSLSINAGPAISFYGSSGNDQISITPAAALKLTIDADHVTTSDVDTLSVTAAINSGFALTPGANAQAGQYTFADGSAPITFSGVERNAPLAVTGSYGYDLPVPAVVVSFTKDVSGSLDPSVLTITRNGTTYAATAVTYDTSTNTATFTVPGLPDGHYVASIDGTLVADSLGYPLVVDAIFGFDVLAGDANHDGIVNFSDLVILAQNYGQTGKSFSQGNFNYSADGSVDFNDLVLLAQHYNQSVPASSLASLGLSGSSTGVSSSKSKSAASRLTELA